MRIARSFSLITLCCLFIHQLQGQTIDAYAQQYLLQAPGSRNAHVGISLFDPVTLIEDVEGHDIRLDIAICPAQLYDFR